jgi:hypothetical protein
VELIETLRGPALEGVTVNVPVVAPWGMTTGELVIVSPPTLEATTHETPPLPAAWSRATVKLAEGWDTCPELGPLKVAVLGRATVTAAVAVWVVSRLPVAVIVAVPEPTAVTRPPALTVATDGAELLQVTP